MNSKENSNIDSNSNNKLLGAGLVSAITASLCCITPVLALVSGASGIASAFSWLDPLRPFLIGVTILVLAFAWYQNLRPRTEEEIACACEEGEKSNFWQSKKFLGIVTVFAVVMMAFPLYADMFYSSQDKKQTIVVESDNLQTATFEIKGMTCNSCASHVENDVNKLDGIVGVDASYEDADATVKYDKSKVSSEEIEAVINGTGYIVISQK
ncbi:mercuric transport protein MerTP [Marivirga salinae]|uniref:Mercuric transport protein MerT n=1 Tax=Marivirga salinarum TaxID=3059078 RepID=A0AA51ND79_9BACT|nr:mercuric transport protein MerTP [Marivirga sp. BDSF4-3]WMN12968.1 mercuric transport protein MerTP [Marivirga sp. BDSF4-3]